MKIHPTAIVAPEARLASDVEVGPWAIVGPEVELGPGCSVGPRATLEGEVVAGENNFFGIGAVIGAPPQDFAFDPASKSRVRIGAGNTFREYVTIHRGTKDGTETVVGDGCFLMAGAHLGHNVRLGDRVIAANNALFAGHVQVGTGAVIGGGAVFHQFIRVGAYVMVRGGGRFSKEIPPYCMADTENLVSGINSVGLRRAGFSSGVRLELRRAFHLLFRSRLNVSQALEEASKLDWSPEARVLIDFVASAKRGVCSAATDKLLATEE